MAHKYARHGKGRLTAFAFQVGIVEIMMMALFHKVKVITQLNTGSGKSTILNLLALWLKDSRMAENILIIHDEKTYVNEKSLIR